LSVLQSQNLEIRATIPALLLKASASMLTPLTLIPVGNQNEQIQVKSDDPMDGGGRATQETKPSAKTGSYYVPIP